MTTGPDPERELVRRAAPWAVLAIALGLAIGTVARGWQVGASAALGLLVVFLNFAVNGVALSRAARVSLTAYSAVVAGGLVVRLAAIVAAMIALSHLAWFSKVAFGLAVVPGTVALLALELRLYAQGVGRELVLPAKAKEGAA
jgi:hypothetical protein